MTPLRGAQPDMRASYLSLHLARYESLRTPAALTPTDDPALLFCSVAADTRAAGTEPASRQAFVFALLGLHRTADSADRLLTESRARAQWLDEAAELWSAVLEPFRHVGEANYLDPAHAGAFVDAVAAAPPPDTPVVAITSSGWVSDEQLDMNRVREFSNGVMSVRASMTGIAGLHSQQSFFFPGVLEYDPITVTVWRRFDDLRMFAYGSGSHRLQLERQRATQLADRTSFTRCRVVRSEASAFVG
jgi:hypothetical protein